jgi:hypothetical protein
MVRMSMVHHTRTTSPTEAATVADPIRGMQATPASTCAGLRLAFLVPNPTDRGAT